MLSSWLPKLDVFDVTVDSMDIDLLHMWPSLNQDPFSIVIKIFSIFLPVKSFHSGTVSLIWSDLKKDDFPINILNSRPNIV